MSMKLKRIVLEDYKQFTGRMVVDDLEPGLNVFVGPNAVGKSTLVDALRKVFLERHKSTTLSNLVPWSKPGSRPRVEVAYEMEGADHLLIKHFVSRPHCELRTGHKRLEGDEAEEELSRILGFARAGKGAMRPELGGIPGLLWVQQGASQNVQESANHAARYLRDALGELAGGTVAQGDDVLIQAVREEMVQLVTDKTRKPVGSYADSERQLKEAEEALNGLGEQEREFNSDIERLSRLQVEVDNEMATKPWESLEQRADAAEQQARAVEAAQELATRTAREVADAERTSTLLNNQEQDAIEEEAAVAALNRQLTDLQTRLEAARIDEAKAKDAIAELQSALSAATEQRTKAEAAAAYAEAAGRLQGAIDAKADVSNRREEAERIAAECRSLTVEATRLEVAPKDIERLRVVEHDLVVSRSRRDAALTRLEYRLQPGRTAVLGDVPLSGQGVVSLDVASTLVIPDVGELTISPGVTDLAELHTHVAANEDERARLLQRLGVAALTEAEERQRAWNQLAADLRTKQALFTGRAPEGLEALRTSLAAAEAKVEDLRGRLPEPPTIPSELTLADAKAAVDLVLSKFDSARDREAAAVDRRARLEGQHQQASGTLAAKQQFMQSAEYLERRTRTRTELANANAKLQTVRETKVAADRSLKELKAAVEVGAADRLRRSAKLARDAFQSKNEKVIDLRARLESVGATGLGEQIGQLRASIEQLGRRHQELKRRAEALQLLHDLLVEERDNLVQQLQAPLTQRIEEYLWRLMPQSRLTVTDGLAPDVLVRDEGSAEFQELSFGTQEQLGVLIRLAYADLLKDAGKPTLLIFDDAVTHSDVIRLERVKRALLHAAERHQVLVLSCHPDNWNDVGVPLRSVEDLKTAAS